MSLIVQTVVLGVVALIIYFVLSPVIAGWVVWGVYLFFTIGLFFHGLSTRKQMQHGEVGDWTAAVMLPPAMIAVFLILILFIFLGFNKLNLLWVAPLVTFIMERVSGRKMYKEIHNREKKITDEIEKTGDRNW